MISRHPGRGRQAASRDRRPSEAPLFTSPQRGEVGRRSRAGEGALRSDILAPPHPALRADLFPPGRGEEPSHILNTIPALRFAPAGMTPGLAKKTQA